MEDQKDWVKPHDCKKCSTSHHLDAHKSSSINHTSLTHLGMKPHQRDNYKLTHIIQTESPHNQLLTGMNSKNWVKPHYCTKCTTGHHLWTSRSSQ